MLVSCWRLLTGNDEMVTCPLKKPGKTEDEKGSEDGFGSASWRQTGVISVVIFVATDVFWVEYKQALGTHRPWGARPGLPMLGSTLSSGPSVTSPHHLGRWVDLCARAMSMTLEPQEPTYELCGLCQVLKNSTPQFLPL